MNVIFDNGSWDNIDPTVWMDEDGQAYLYWGNPHLYYAKLNKDMISFKGGIILIWLRWGNITARCLVKVIST